MLINDYIIAIENKQYLKPDKILPIAGSAILGIPLGLLTTNILFINQYPDYTSDKKVGKNHLVELLYFLI